MYRTPRHCSVPRTGAAALERSCFSPAGAEATPPHRHADLAAGVSCALPKERTAPWGTGRMRRVLSPGPYVALRRLGKSGRTATARCRSRQVGRPGGRAARESIWAASSSRSERASGVTRSRARCSLIRRHDMQRPPILPDDMRHPAITPARPPTIHNPADSLGYTGTHCPPTVSRPRSAVNNLLGGREHPVVKPRPELSIGGRL